MTFNHASSARLMISISVENNSNKCRIPHNHRAVVPVVPEAHRISTNQLLCLSMFNRHTAKLKMCSVPVDWGLKQMIYLHVDWRTCLVSVLSHHLIVKRWLMREIAAEFSRFQTKAWLILLPALLRTQTIFNLDIPFRSMGLLRESQSFVSIGWMQVQWSWTPGGNIWPLNAPLCSAACHWH